MQNPFSNSSGRTYLDYPHLREVQDYVDYARDLGALLVVLFGSVARGEFRVDSDADVLVLTDKPISWRQIYKRTHGIVQPVVKTAEEYLAQVREGEPFFVEMIEEGILLHDSDGWHQRLTEEVQSAKARCGLRRTEYGWQWTR